MSRRETVSRPHNEAEYKELLSELSALQKKLESKVEALLNVSQDLARSQKDCDSWKNTAEALEARVHELETSVNAMQTTSASRESTVREDREKLVALLQSGRIEQRSLQEEAVQLRQQLREARGDAKRLARQQLQEYCSADELPFSAKTSIDLNVSVESDEAKTADNDGSAALEDVERLREEYAQLERDLRAVLCEKEELVCDRDTYKSKCSRLSQELSLIMNGDERRVVSDVDGVLAENRYLKAQLASAREETGLTRAALNRYRSLVERRKKPALTPTGPGALLDQIPKAAVCDAPAALAVVTPKQIAELLGDSAAPQTTDYKALATALFDAVGDKNLALTHQRKANKILGCRVTELEARLRDIETRSPARVALCAAVPADPPAAQHSHSDAMPLTPPTSAAL